MANRIVGNVMIIDTATGNDALDMPSKVAIQTVSFFAANSTGHIDIAGTNTTDVVIHMHHNGGINADSNESMILNGVNFETLKVPTLTAGTAWIYFS